MKDCEDYQMAVEDALGALAAFYEAGEKASEREAVDAVFAIPVVLREFERLRDAIRFHLFVCPLPSRNLREAIGYDPDVQLARPEPLPMESLEELIRADGSVNLAYQLRFKKAGE
jgi:hypothetical protein